MRFLLLGPVRGEAAGRAVGLGTRQQRLVAAVLALEANRLVLTDRLVDMLWSDRPPASARSAVRGHISLLRRILRGVGAGADGVRIDSAGAGYLLRCDPDLVDAHRFRGLVRQARQVTDDRRRVVLLDEALGLWRGPALAGTTGEDLRAALCRDLDESRLSAVEDRAEALLRMGCHHELTEDLAVLAGAHPDRQRLTGALMRALHRTGRTAQALEVYQRAAEHLRDELGLDPPDGLRDLHLSILRAEPDPTTPEGVSEPPTDAPVPRQLPAGTAHFTGREAELDRLLAAHGREPGPVVIGAIDGMAGVGKTALAVHAAHRIAGHYPDGQVFVDLHGFTDGVAPTDPGAALEVLLRSIGLVSRQIPAGLDERAALWRTRLSGRRLLVVLDNARDETQVAPLLPGSPGCLVLVTSRRRLSGLDGAEPVSLDVLPASEAVALFTATVGLDRLTGALTGVDSRAVGRLVEVCGRLPLAIRIAAARLRHHQGWTVGHLLDLLRGEHGPLAALHAGQRSVTATLNLSYQDLTADQRRLYRRLGPYPGPDIEPYAAAALLGAGLEATRRLLDDLHEAHLLVEPVPGRYRFHDLVRQHAATLATADSRTDRDAAIGRLCDHHAHVATVAMNLAYPFDADQRPRPGPAHTPVPEFGAPAAAEAWLDAELDNHLAAAAIAADRGRPDHALRLAAILRRHLRTRARRALDLHHHALAAARQTGDPVGELAALVGVGQVHRLDGHYEQAAGCFARALDIACDTGHRTGELDASVGLGHVHRMRGGYHEATRYYRRALGIARECGYRAGELDAMDGLGQVHLMRGRHGPAADCFGQALGIARDTGNRTSELGALVGLALVRLMQGRYGPAADCFGGALTIARDTGNHDGELNALNGLGNIHAQQGRHRQAADHFERALGIARDIGNRTGELDALTGLGNATRQQDVGRAAGHYRRVLAVARDIGDRNYQFEAHQGLGWVHRATGDFDRALASHAAALELAGDLGQPQDQARAQDGMAHAHLALGHPGRAGRHWRAALDALAAHGIDHTEDPQVTAETIRAHLAGLAPRQTGATGGQRS